MIEQPSELQDYLDEAEAIVTEWYSRDGVESSHEANVDKLATLLCLTAVMQPDKPFHETLAAARLYLVAAFQMGRATHGDDRRTR